MVRKVKRKLSKAEIKNILKDWFDRDGSTYVRATTKHRLDWEKSLKEGAAYSSYLLEAPTDKDLFVRAFPMARDTLTAMMLPVKTRLRVGTQEESFTDGERVVLSTKVFDDKTLSNGDKLDVFLGLAVHEGAHIKYTNFGDLKIHIKNRIVKWFENVIEDERIEINVGEDTPGFSRFLEKLKYYYFNKKFKETFKGWDDFKNTFEKITMIFLRLIRYPTELRESDIEYLGDYIIRIKRILQPYPISTYETIKAAEKIYELLKEFIIEEEKTAKGDFASEPTEGDSGDGEEGEGSGKSSDKGDKKDDKKKGKGKDKKSDKGAEDEKGDETGDSDGEGEDGSEGSGKYIEITSEDLDELEKRLTKEGAEETARVVVILKDLGHPKVEPLGTDTGEAVFVRLDPHLLKEIEGIVERPDSHTFIEKQFPKPYMYLQSYNRIKKYIPAIANHLRAHARGYKIIHRSMRTGHLDTNKLVEGYLGVPNIYMREGEVKTDKLTLVLLGDESGSMDGDSIISAMDSIVLIKEAVQSLPNVNLFIYGHSADIHGLGVTDLYTYHEPGWTPKHSLGSMRARVQNRDGNAILETAKRVRKFSKEPALLLVMSDGQPHAGGYVGSMAIQHTRQCVKQVQKMGFRVVQIAINHSYDPKQMFDHFLVLDNMSTLARDLGRVVKKAVEQLTEIKVT